MICLQEGTHALPQNVRVHSLGKSAQGPSPKLISLGLRSTSGWGRLGLRLRYSARFLRLVIGLRREYDAVFVHQNQEYVLLAGIFWRILGKRVFMWRNHYAGSFLTGIAAFFCDKLFCTSAHSYTARYKKTVRMPIGVDTDLFVPGALPHPPHSILFIGRMASSKRPDVLVEALGLLAARGIAFNAQLVGPTLPKDRTFLTALKRRIAELHLVDRVMLREGVPHAATPALYATNELFVNLSGSGMYDKTLFEAAASGCLVVALSRDFAQEVSPEFVPADESAHAVADALQHALTMPAEEKESIARTLRAFAEANSLAVLASRLAQEMKV